MYAVVDIKGFQFKLEKGDTLRVPKFDLEVGKKINLSDVLLVADGGMYAVGQPYVEGAVVEATVTGQGKYDKILVFKKKRRKDYSVKKGHRQDYTEISVDGIMISKKKSNEADEETPEQAAAAVIIPDAVETAVETAETGKKAVKKTKASHTITDIPEPSGQEQQTAETEES